MREKCRAADSYVSYSKGLAFFPGFIAPEKECGAARRLKQPNAQLWEGCYRVCRLKDTAVCKILYYGFF